MAPAPPRLGPGSGRVKDGSRAVTRRRMRRGRPRRRSPIRWAAATRG